MPDYGFFEIEADGHIRRPARILTLPSDADAIERAKRLVGARDIEIWDGCRVVTRIKRGKATGAV